MRINPSCPACGHGTMYPLERFYEDDVNESPTVDHYSPTHGEGRIAPTLVSQIMILSWLSNLVFGKAKVAKGKLKVRKAREEILPRSPKSLICPNCYEVLERL